MDKGLESLSERVKRPRSTSPVTQTSNKRALSPLVAASNESDDDDDDDDRANSSFFISTSPSDSVPVDFPSTTISYDYSSLDLLAELPILGISPPSSPIEPTIKAETDERTCFNCQGHHLLNDCPFRFDYRLIAKNRERFNEDHPKMKSLSSTSTNGDGDVQRRLDLLHRFRKPGTEISPELRNALDVRGVEYPWYDRFVEWGYPPGWTTVSRRGEETITIKDVFQFIQKRIQSSKDTIEWDRIEILHIYSQTTLETAIEAESSTEATSHDRPSELSNAVPSDQSPVLPSVAPLTLPSEAPPPLPSEAPPPLPPDPSPPPPPGSIFLQAPSEPILLTKLVEYPSNKYDFGQLDVHCPLLNFPLTFHAHNRHVAHCIKAEKEEVDDGEGEEGMDFGESDSD